MFADLADERCRWTASQRIQRNDRGSIEQPRIDVEYRIVEVDRVDVGQAIVPTNAKLAAGPFDQIEHALVRDDRALRLARGAGCEHDVSGIGSGDLTRLRQIVVVKSKDLVAQIFKRSFILDDDAIAQAGANADDQRRLAPIEHQTRPLHRGGRIEKGVRRPDLDAGHCKGVSLDHLRKFEANNLTALYAARRKPTREPVCQPIQPLKIVALSVAHNGYAVRRSINDLLEF